ncbi:hypothetical protein L209DRAFT_756800 [Thermothelomyces heterothallicus CBS 203.75]
MSRAALALGFSALGAHLPRADRGFLPFLAAASHLGRDPVACGAVNYSTLAPSSQAVSDIFRLRRHPSQPLCFALSPRVHTDN